MLAIPSIDLRDGQCEWYLGGELAASALRREDPLHLARRYVAAGFSALHLADLDAADERGSNRDVLLELLRYTPGAIQVGGGAREQLPRFLDEGAARIVVDAAAAEDPTWIEEQAWSAPGRVLLAVEVRGRRLVRRGWARQNRDDLFDLLSDLASLPFGGLLVNAAPPERALEISELALFEDLAMATEWPIISNGGVRSLQDLRNLQARGVAAVVLDTALLAETLDPRVVAEEFWD